MPDSPTIYDFPFMQEEDAQAQARAMAAALRRQQMQGLALQALTGGQKAGPLVGGQLTQEAGQQMGLGAKMLEDRQKYQIAMKELAQRQAQQTQEAELQRQWRSQETEQERQNRLQMARIAAQARLGAANAAWGSGIGGGPAGGEGSPVAALADAIVRGEQPPEIKGLYRWGGPVKAELAKRGYDLSSANLDWQATQKNLATLNGPQQLRMRQAAMTANESLNNIEQLYNEWKQLGGATGFRLLNKASLAMSKNSPGRIGAVAQALEMNIADLTSELGNVYMGGNTPTEQALKLARENLAANWNEQQFMEAIKQARKNLGYRLNSIKHSAPMGLGGPSRYAPSAPEAAPPAAQPSGTEDLRKKYGL
jgi:hypothetical protein